MSVTAIAEGTVITKHCLLLFWEGKAGFHWSLQLHSSSALLYEHQQNGAGKHKCCLHQIGCNEGNAAPALPKLGWQDLE